MERVALLISPAPLDGYPPVQNQARILADRGYRVSVLTTPKVGSEHIDFKYPGVSVTCISAAGAGRMKAAKRLSLFCTNIWRWRSQLRGKDGIEIVYEPLGFFYSDITPAKPRVRLAHLHENLSRMDSVWLERRLQDTLRRYQFVSVADRRRGEELQKQLDLATPPFVIPNYPLVAEEDQRPAPRRQDAGFEVIYAGSVGTHQCLDLIVRSVPLWPAGSRLAIVGNDESAIGQALKRLAGDLGVADRVKFEGWVPYERIVERLSQADLAISMYSKEFSNTLDSLGASNKRYIYMKAGLPQIGDNIPGVPELLEGRGVGLCVREDSPEAIGALVRRYVEDPDRCRREGELARSLVDLEFNYENAFEPVLDEIERTFRSKRGPGNAGRHGRAAPSVTAR